MPAYAIAISKMKDAELYGQYLAEAAGTIGPFNGVVRAFDDNSHILEGEPVGPRCVMIEFPTKEDALAWYNSPEYQAAMGKRHAATDGFFIIAQGM